MKSSRIKLYFLIQTLGAFIGGVLIKFIFDSDVLHSWTAWIPTIILATLSIIVSIWLQRRYERAEDELHTAMERLRNRPLGPNDL